MLANSTMPQPEGRLHSCELLLRSHMPPPPASITVTPSPRCTPQDALDNYDTPFCSLEAMPGLEEFPEVQPHADAGSSSAAAAPEEAAQPAALASV
jgi:hypothetical protein